MLDIARRDKNETSCIINNVLIRDIFFININLSFIYKKENVKKYLHRFVHVYVLYQISVTFESLLWKEI